MTRTETRRFLTTPHDADLARDALTQLSGAQGRLTIERDGHAPTDLPAELGRLMQNILDVVAQGGTVTIGSIPDVLTTSTAAQILGISRPTLMRMIRDGAIDSHMVGTHHRLKSNDVFAALRARRERERNAFADLLEAEGDED